MNNVHQMIQSSYSTIKTEEHVWHSCLPGTLWKWEEFIHNLSILHKQKTFIVLNWSDFRLSSIFLDYFQSFLYNQ